MYVLYISSYIFSSSVFSLSLSTCCFSLLFFNKDTFSEDRILLNIKTRHYRSLIVGFVYGRHLETTMGMHL